MWRQVETSQTFTTMNEQDPEALVSFLSKLGLDTFYPNKLTLHSLLEIHKSSLTDEAVNSLDKIPQCFLRKLFRINADCRGGVQLPDNSENDEDMVDFLDVDWDPIDGSAEDKINPLDLIVALFLCADSFLQQEMASKMSMCQFSVPLLLPPHGSQSPCSLMLWALRDIVKEWRPLELCESKGFVKKSIILENLPFYCFVRLKNCTLSKSQLLNHVLSCGQQNHNIFVHRDMKGGAHDRRLASGLVEVCWSLPSGNKNLDKFPEPVGFANLRGDISESLPQFRFLYQVSALVFVFLDKVEEEEHKILTSLADLQTKLFLVFNCKEGTSKLDALSFQKLKKDLNLPDSRVKIRKSNLNVAEFSEKLCSSITESMTSGGFKVNINYMHDKAVELGLSVDETRGDDQKKEAEQTLNGIRVNKIKDYKDKQLPLQGDKWKSLSQLEMEECRLKKCIKTGIEEYKCELQAEKEKIINEQSKYKLSRAMKCFTKDLLEVNKKTEQSREKTEDRRENRDFFLKWIQIHLNAHLQSDTQLSQLHSKIKKESSKEKKDENLIAELYQELLDSSLGIEHYMREMGLIYEFSTNRTSEEICRLPGVAADMLLDGHPLELLDGDASNIPETWVTDVLMELHNRVGGMSRLLVLTVLGVQSTGKSTLLNTMFGVQFPVSSGRCTRGAYMIFLRVGDDVKSDLNCDFIVLIDTEGLRSPLLGLPEETLEHDNQLATFVIGLSDVTIINVAMEQSTEMQDTLQIATHAFLRMNEIGKKPVCHFVHQNVAAVSANDRNLSERQKLLDQLNEMAKEASEMEGLPDDKAFTDVMDYDINKNNWNIPGLWHGTPPMAPVNTGYSEAVAELKKHLLQTMSGDSKRQASQIPEFLEWIKSLWKSVKYENFLFSFRNSLVANAYDTLCIEFNRWEWELRKKIFTWQKAVELEILNTDTHSKVQGLEDLIELKKTEVSQKLTDEETQMKEKLDKYYEKKDANVNLIEKYRNDFLNSIGSITKEVRLSVNNKLDQTLQLKKCSIELQEKLQKYREVIEKQMKKFVSDEQRSSLSDDDLKDEFEKMWTKVTETMVGLNEQNIYDNIIKVLRGSFLNRKVNEFFLNIGDLKEIGKGPFQVKPEHMKGFPLFKYLKFQNDMTRDLQKIADEVTETCRTMLNDVLETNSDYHESLTKELLDKTDQFLKTHKRKCKTRFEFDLKLHICGIASKEFLKMHQKFLKDNGPQTQLEKFKTQYLTDFLSLYKLRSTDQVDNCEYKANVFVQSCIEPGVKELINRSLGIDIMDEVLKSSESVEFSTRSFFQQHIMQELLLKGDFQSFLKYISTYEIYIKDWIRQHILDTVSKNETLCKIRKKKLQVIIDRVSLAITQASKRADGTMLPDNKESITELIENIMKGLNKDMLIPFEAVKVSLFEIQSTSHSFIKSLRVALDQLSKRLQEEFSKCKDVKETLDKLPVKPQDELFKRVFGCGHQCPFCKVPCGVGLKEHKHHQTAVHRPQGLGGYRDFKTQKLWVSLCTTDVQCQSLFRNQDTEYQWHPYKEYKDYYPDWHIPPDVTPEASDYWKYVLVKYNEDFASAYKAKPADVPEAWKTITEEQVLNGLKDAFNVK
ncbi:up-regulator of cell proliferation-like [Betta splendens]|uniref:Up-regulator of cell proliferation-like n=1 Tax=Betta splendens TaxID=158456 RepID=A0A6P7LIR1_BETSP|nr:up-regulator of cell proliferation-like [Betta splendens]